MQPLHHSGPHPGPSPNRPTTGPGTAATSGTAASPAAVDSRAAAPPAGGAATLPADRAPAGNGPASGVLPWRQHAATANAQPPTTQPATTQPAEAPPAEAPPAEARPGEAPLPEARPHRTGSPAEQTGPARAAPAPDGTVAAPESALRVDDLTGETVDVEGSPDGSVTVHVAPEVEEPPAPAPATPEEAPTAEPATPVQEPPAAEPTAGRDGPVQEPAAEAPEERRELAAALAEEVDGDHAGGGAGAQRVAGPEPVPVADTATATDPPPATHEPTAAWSPAAARKFRDRWHAAAAEFVDDPEAGVAAAGDLVADAVRALAERLLAERAGLLPEQSARQPDTEALRLAMRGHRDLLERILAR